MTRGGSVSEDARLELAMAASARERGSRPLGLVVLAGLVLAGCIGLAAWGLVSRASARAAAERRGLERVRVEQLMNEIQSLEQQRAASGVDSVGQRIPDMLSRVERLAQEAGLKDKLAAPREGTERKPSGNVELKYTYDNVKDASLPAILEWVSLVPGRIPGTDVWEVKLDADPNQWTARVVFRRVEKRQ